MDEFKPTRLESAKWHIKNHLGAAALLGIIALGALLYLAAMTALSHYLFHRRH